MRGVAGIDLGGTLMRVAVADGRGQIRHQQKRLTGAQRGPEAVIEDLVEGVRNAAKAAGLRVPDLEALVVGVPGPVDTRRGTVLTPPNLPGWHHVPLAAILRRRLRVRAYLENDANLAAVGEHRRGAGRGADNLIYVTISTGIGGGLILDGRLYRGSTGTAGEVGHMVVVPDGPRCSCGNRGCLEAVASGTGIARRARVLMQGRRRPGATPVSAEWVVTAARAGDRLAAAVLIEAGTALGRALGSLVNLLNPEVIILGGGVSQAGRLLMSPMRASLADASFPEARAATRIVRARLGQDAGLVGAVEWARMMASRRSRP